MKYGCIYLVSPYSAGLGIEKYDYCFYLYCSCISLLWQCMCVVELSECCIILAFTFFVLWTFGGTASIVMAKMCKVCGVLCVCVCVCVCVCMCACTRSRAHMHVQIPILLVPFSKIGLYIYIHTHTHTQRETPTLHTLTMKMEASCTSKTSVTSPTSVWYTNPTAGLTSASGDIQRTRILKLHIMHVLPTGFPKNHFTLHDFFDLWP
jgi:hypothetical protein